jgi:glutaredoxin
MLVALALAVPAGTMAQQTLYRWVDKDGKVQFSDTPPNEDVKNVTQKNVGRGPGSSQLPYATQVAMKKSPVVLYAAGRDCPASCAQARSLLASRGIPYSELDVQTSQEAADALKKRGDDLFVPSLTVGEVLLKGYKEDSWNAALDSAGYPRTALPGAAIPKPPEPSKAPPPEPAPAEGQAAPPK